MKSAAPPPEAGARQQATEELSEMGPPARGPITEELKKPRSLEVKRRCEYLLRRMQAGSVPPDELRSTRAIEALERIGSPAAKDVLKNLLKLKLAPEIKSAVELALGRLNGG